MYDPDFLSQRPSRGGGLGLTAKQLNFLTPSQTVSSRETPLSFHQQNKFLNELR